MGTAVDEKTLDLQASADVCSCVHETESRKLRVVSHDAKPHPRRMKKRHIISLLRRSGDFSEQTTDDFLRCIENAFFEFGGVPQTLVIDNLRAAVSAVDWFDPELCPKARSFAEHYRVAILPTKPYTPRHKGKIENGINYVKNNALKARRFSTLAEENQHLRQWEQTVADTLAIQCAVDGRITGLPMNYTVPPSWSSIFAGTALGPEPYPCLTADIIPLKYSDAPD